MKRDFKMLRFYDCKLQLSKYIRMISQYFGYTPKTLNGQDS